MRIKGNKVADKAAKEASFMLGMATARLPSSYKGGLETPNDKENKKTVLVSDTTLNPV